MFQIIVAIISIALFAALAGTTTFYGGDAFYNSTSKSNVTALVNQGQQIGGAGALFSTDNAGAEATDIDTDLVANDYLQAAPTPSAAATGAWDITDDGEFAFVSINNAAIEAVCTEVENQNGSATDETTVDATFTSATVLTGIDAQFACVVDNADLSLATAGSFVFKM